MKYTPQEVMQYIEEEDFIGSNTGKDRLSST